MCRTSAWLRAGTSAGHALGCKNGGLVVEEAWVGTFVVDGI